MSRLLVWLLGGGAAVAGAAVAGWIVLDQQRGGSEVAPDTDLTVTAPQADPVPAPAGAGGEAGGEELSASADIAEDAAPEPLPDAGPTAETAPTETAPTETALADAVEPEEPRVETTADAPLPDATQPVPPRFDVVRVARDGAALVAGEAAPGAAVTLRVDGAVVAETAADAAGQFVAMFDLGSSDAVQVMTLEMAGADGVVIGSEDTVVLTPRPARVASVEPAPDAAPSAPMQIAEGGSAASPSGQGLGAPVGGETVVQAEPAAISAAVDPAGTMPDPQPATQPETRIADGQQTTPAVDADPIESADAARIALSDAPEVPDAPVVDDAVEDGGDMPTAFIVRGGGSVELVGAPPQVMDNVVIDSISYSASGDVQIAGRAARTGPDANLRIYLNNRPIAVAQAERGGWASDLPQVDPGVYTLRVDQLNAEGGVVSRFETPFQREAPEVVARAQARAAGQSGQVADLATDDADPAEAATDAGTASAAPPAAGGSGPLPQTGAEVATAAPAAEGAPQAATQNAAATALVATPAPATRNVSAETVPPVSLITVQPGHTLWAISRDRYGAGELYVVIYRANRSQIRNPNLIYPGQIFELPQQ